MPQYMLLIYEDPATAPDRDSPQAQQEFAEYGEFTECWGGAPRCRRARPPPRSS